MKLLSLFPTAIGVFELGREFTKTELKFINELDKRPNKGNQTSVDSHVFKSKKLAKLEDFCLQSAGKYIENVVVPKTDISLYITQSWVNYTEKQQYHHVHAHPNSYVSGVLFIQTDSEKDSLCFHSSHGYTQFKISSSNYNMFNSESWWVPAVSGTLLIFPSYLPHSVESVVSDKTRISLSFNTFLKGNLGTQEDLTELIID